MCANEPPAVVSVAEVSVTDASVGLEELFPEDRRDVHRRARERPANAPGTGQSPRETSIQYAHPGTPWSTSISASSAIARARSAYAFSSYLSSSCAATSFRRISVSARDENGSVSVLSISSRLAQADASRRASPAST